MNDSDAGVDILDEAKSEERIVNERVGKMSENQLLTFKRTNEFVFQKIFALNEIEAELRLIDGGEADFEKKQKKVKVHNIFIIFLSLVLLYFLNLSVIEKGFLFLFAVVWIFYNQMENMNVRQTILLRKFILKTELINLKAEIQACGVFYATAQEYLRNNKLCIDSEINSEPIRKKFILDYRLSKVRIQNEILDVFFS